VGQASVVVPQISQAMLAKTSGATPRHADATRPSLLKFETCAILNSLGEVGRSSIVHFLRTHR
jgi:hypothetical protein